MPAFLFRCQLLHAAAWLSYSSSQPVLPPASVLTKGTQRETRGSFTAAPVMLFVYEAGQALSRCGLQLAFHANFTFSLSPQSGRVGFNGFAFVVSATDRVGSSAGVGYGGMDKRSMAVEFDTRQDKQHGDMSSQHVGLNVRGEDRSLAAVRSPFPLSNRKAYTVWVDYEPGDPGTIQVFLADSQEKPQEALLERRLALCEVLQGAAEQPAFFFGFVASTTVKPFQRHVILESTVDTVLVEVTIVLVKMRAVPAKMRSVLMKVRVELVKMRVVPVNKGAGVHEGLPASPRTVVRYPGACWAFALVASVEAAYGIAMNAEAPQLSVESLFAAMGLTSEADKCITGGSPTEAFERLLTLPRAGVTEAGAPVSSEKKYYPVHGFERTRFKLFVGLMLAVRRQPVVVHIEASAPEFAQYDRTFKFQDPGCYTGRLNHVVLVVGYFVLRNDGSQSRIAPPFWIIRNSWGVEWGDRGHMRMDIQGGDGVCGINVLPGIYPIVKMDVCGSDLKNPCYVGACINDGKGSYSCICPPNYVASTTIDSFPTCDPVLVLYSVGFYQDISLLPYLPSLLCVSSLVHIVQPCSVQVSLPVQPSKAFFRILTVTFSPWHHSSLSRPPCFCAASPQQGCHVISTCYESPASPQQGCPCSFCIKHPSLLSCHSTLQSDTCWSISAQLFLTSRNLTALNPGLNCSEPIKAGRSLCIERNATFAFTVPQCLRYGLLTPQDTCERLLLQVAGIEDDPTGAGKVDAMRWAELYRNNPGLICSSVIPASASAVGSNTGLQVRVGGESERGAQEMGGKNRG
ncbi:unnamed protein product [Closterium sp. Yama58-4]|nr:unnamed protein product [Closterium sp. Yama58-4]